MDAESVSISRSHDAPSHTRTSSSGYYLVIGSIIVAIAAISWFAIDTNGNSQRPSNWKAPAPLDPKRAIANIVEICSFGTRVSGSPGMIKQQQWLRKQFAELGGQITWQEWDVRHPVNGSTVHLKNMIVSFGPPTKERLLVCAHYDTRPYPDQDRKNPKGIFLGANDGASGPALMIELAHAFKNSPPEIGVDMVLFDAEELIYSEQDRYFLGSEYFARTYITRKDGDPTYRYGVLVDMIADKRLELYYEGFSFHYAKDLTQSIWKIASDLKIREFVDSIRYEVRDDHLPLNRDAKIPVCDIIDFAYPTSGNRVSNYWHTEQDTPDKCSGESVCKVATVLLKWIELQPPAKN